MMMLGPGKAVLRVVLTLVSIIEDEDRNFENETVEGAETVATIDDCVWLPRLADVTIGELDEAAIISEIKVIVVTS